jgi:TldD protein
MRPPDVVFADNGIRMVRRYGGPRPGEKVQAWRGVCVEFRSPSGVATEHVFADGTALLRDRFVRLGATAVDQARTLLAEPAPPVVPPPEVDRALHGLAQHRQVAVTWASVSQRVAVGDAEQLVTDERLLCTVEITVVGSPACSEVVRWDSARWDTADDTAGLRRIAVAADRVCALAALPAAEPPAAACDLVLEPGWAGSFFHELLGHPLEADIVAARASYLCDRFGETIAPSWLTVTDGPPPPGDGLTASVDDEGTPISTVELIASGRVSGMLSDVPTAALGRTQSSGHGRRLDYRHPVIPRMWHTVARGTAAPAQPPGAVRLAPRGLRLRRMNVLTGDFEFLVETASLDTGTGQPCRTGPCTVTGNALTVLAALGPGRAECRAVGRATRGCGKLGQFPLVTTFANRGVWIPAEAMHVRSDPAA